MGRAEPQARPYGFPASELERREVLNLSHITLIAMRASAAVLLLCCSALAGSAMVVHQKTLTATEGNKVILECQLTKPHDVLQVTWQKDTGDFAGNMATYSKGYGQRLVGPYKSRHITFSKLEPNDTALTLHEVSLTDEGCYKCIFNVYPTGSIAGRTCLYIYAIYQPKLETHHIWNAKTSEKEEVISCSATGKPAPVLTWNLTEDLQGIPQNYSFVNPNQTVTVISNFTYIPSQLSHENTVACVLRHPALTVELKLPAALEEKSTFSSSASVTISTFLSVLFVLSVLGIC